MAAVWFDLDGTLVGFDRPYEDLVADGFRAAGVTPDDALVAAYVEAFSDAFDALTDDPYRTAAARALDDAGVDASPDAVTDALLDAEVAATVAAPAAAEALDAVGADHRVGVLSDGTASLQHRKLRAAGLAERVDAVVTSYEVGAHKPDPAAFRAARERLPADRHVLVGDDPEGDVAGAADAGFCAVHLDADLPGDAAVASLAVLRDGAALFR